MADLREGGPPPRGLSDWTNSAYVRLPVPEIGPPMSATALPTDRERSLRFSLNRRSILALTILAFLPIIAVTFSFMLQDLSSFSDPCVHWGVGGGTVSVTPVGPCPGGITSVSETIPEAITRMSLIQGGILFALILATVGIVASRRKLLVVSATILALESIPFVFDGLFLLTLPLAWFLFWQTKRKDGSRPTLIRRADNWGASLFRWKLRPLVATSPKCEIE